MSSVEQRAREIYAREWDKIDPDRAARIRSGDLLVTPEIRAIAAALREQPVQEGGGECSQLCMREMTCTNDCAPPSAPVGVECPATPMRLIGACPSVAFKAGWDARHEAGQSGSIEEREARLAETDPRLYVRIRGPIDQQCRSVWEHKADLYDALTQQPAQAAPGDGRHRYEQSGEHGGCSVCGYPAHERLLHTPPGDDAAGGVG